MRPFALTALSALAAVALAGCASSATADHAPAHSYARTAPGAAAPVDPSDVAVNAQAASVRTVPTIDDGTRRLVIPAQHVDAAVFDCGTKNGIVEPPPMVKDVCWWTGSRPLKSAEGTSIVVGHSTRAKSSTGALERTRELPLGSVVRLAGQTWKVAAIETDVDKRGLPAWITAVNGPRQLGLITCDLTNHASNVLIRLVPA